MTNSILNYQGTYVEIKNEFEPSLSVTVQYPRFNAFKKINEEAKINWSAYGSVETEVAAVYQNLMFEAFILAEKLNSDLDSGKFKKWSVRFVIKDSKEDFVDTHFLNEFLVREYVKRMSNRNSNVEYVEYWDASRQPLTAVTYENGEFDAPLEQ